MSHIFKGEESETNWADKPLALTNDQKLFIGQCYQWAAREGQQFFMLKLVKFGKSNKKEAFYAWDIKGLEWTGAEYDGFMYCCWTFNALVEVMTARMNEEICFESKIPEEQVEQFIDDQAKREERLEPKETTLDTFF